MKLKEHEKEFVKEMMKEKDFEEYFKEKSQMIKFIDNNLTKKRLKSFSDKENLFEFDAHYHFRTMQMVYLKLIEYGVDLNSGNVIGGRPSLQLLSLNTNLSFNEQVKNMDVDEILWGLFKETNNKIFARRMPFPLMFIDKTFEISKDIFCFGIGIVYSENKDNSKEFVNTISVLGYDFNDKTEWRMWFDIMNDGKIEMGRSRELFETLKIKDLSENIAKLFCNIIDFLNHPNVKIKVKKWLNNEKRIKRGKFPIPDKIEITLTGNLYKYVNKTLPKMQKESSKFSFWVRGHYIHFWNKKRYKRLYFLPKDELEKESCYTNQEGVVCKWVLPYIKCKDQPFKKKVYKLK